MSELDEVVGEFLVESYENLDRLDQDLLALEQAPDDHEALGSIFRTMHTIKGTCGFLGFSRLERITHVAENLLGKLRDGELQVTPEIATALLATGDATRATLAAIEETGSEGEESYEELVATLERLQDGGAQPAKPLIGQLLVDGGATSEEQVTLAAHEQDLGDERRLGEILLARGEVDEAQVGQALARQEVASPGVAQHSIRIDVRLLDELMNLVGELVLARNQMLQLGVAFDDASFASATQRLNLVTSELQEGVMKTRMQPISTIWSRFPRVVRDLATACGKRVRVDMEGEGTELDKTIIEAVKDPLTHLVRNAVDHGVELPGVREAAGKDAEARLALRAFHEGGQVNIEISDDGAGIDPDAVRAKAVDKGVVTAEQARLLSDRDAVNLIFTPGFSTAASVTSVSGRGVGMDVVRTNVERIGGTVDLHSEPGRGTTFRVKIPLTLAIIPALVVTSAGERYAIPQVGLLELVRLEGHDAATGIEMIGDTPVYRLRGRLLPIVYLDEQLGLAGRGDHAGQARNIVVLQTEGQAFGLVVDEVNDTQEIVVKPLGQQVRDVPQFAGATIMGDGRVALILDILGIGTRAGVAGARARLDRGTPATAAAAETVRRRALLLVGLGGDRRGAVPLSQVARLETFPLSALESAGGRLVVQYRGGILPLVPLVQPPVGGRGDGAEECLEVVVHTIGGRDVGVLVERIIDIVEEPAEESGTTAPLPGGAVVVQGRVADLVDVDAAVHGVLPELTPEYEGAGR